MRNITLTSIVLGATILVSPLSAVQAADIDAATTEVTAGLDRCNDVVKISLPSKETVLMPAVSSPQGWSNNCGMKSPYAGTSPQGVGIVKTLQHALNVCNGAKVREDNQYGPATGEAVGGLQHKHNFGVDRIFGPQTAKVMSWPTAESGTCVSVKDLGRWG